MIKTTTELIILKAEGDLVLCDGSLYCKTIFLGTTDSEENWEEMTEQEALNLIKENEEKAGEGDGI